MLTLYALLCLAVVDFGSGKQPFRIVGLNFPQEYYFEGEEIDTITGIIKPFKIWHSEKLNRSRLDAFDVIRRYYYWSSGNIYMIYSQTAQDDFDKKIVCDLFKGNSTDASEFRLKDMTDLLQFKSYYYAGDEELENSTVEVYKSKAQIVATKVILEYTLIVKKLQDGLTVPLHHYTKKLNPADGSIIGNIVVNYFFYETKVAEEDLDINANGINCDASETLTDDLNEAVQYLHPAIDSDVHVAFHMFKKHHNYEFSQEEHQYRKEIFKRNWHMIVNHNAKKLGFTLGLNQFADKTEDELAYLSGSIVSTDPIQGTHPFPLTEAEVHEIAEDLPVNFDLRNEGVITPVKNQAVCGSCWAFASVATMEGAWARSYGQLIDLSEQSLVDCAWGYNCSGCFGGNANSLRFVNKHGIPTEAEYGPYIAEDGICKIKNKNDIEIKGFAHLPNNNKYTLKVALHKFGPVMVGVLVTKEMELYTKGIHYDSFCNFNSTVRHAVTLVGYGKHDDDDYWIIKNSWGERWGESGYFRLSAADKNCNVLQDPYVVFV
ncbi:hypothetical protein O0L34_g17705 [Tuta absoluta]|nr:hypothetical protein O0L34_g17705 [Tuta absoluta]